MRLVQVLSLVLGVYCGRLLAAICPPDWHRYGESCYLVITDTMNWYEANRTCAESRSNLAVPNSQSEQDYIYELFLKKLDPTSNDRHPWIGCNDIEEEGKWQHCPLKGEASAYENWAEGEPNDGDDREDCGVQDKNRNGQWNDMYCDIPRFAICELPTSSGDRLTPQCLLHHAMEELLDECVGSCGNACQSHPQCHSFNLLEQDGGKMVCPKNSMGH